MSRRQWAVAASTSTAIVVALGALGTAVVALNRDSDLEHKLQSVRGQVRVLSNNTEIVETTHRVNAAYLKLEQVGPKLGALLACVPEIQGEINGLSISWELPGSLSERQPRFEISNTKQISANCEPTLYGTK